MQPPASRVMVVPRMPVLLHGEPRNLEPARQHAQARRPRERFADLAGQRGDQIAPGLKLLSAIF